MQAHCVRHSYEVNAFSKFLGVHHTGTAVNGLRLHNGTIQVNDLAGDKTRHRRREETHHMGKLLRLAKAADRDVLEQLLPLLFRQLFGDHGCLDIRRCDGVGRDAK